MNTGAFIREGERILIVGCGLTGLSLARFADRAGARVRVVDSRNTPPQATALAGACPEAELISGAMPVSALDDIETVVVSPGVDLRCPLLTAARDRGHRLSGDIDWFARAANAPIIAITGSNGKSTVTAWTREVLAGCGLDAVACGNYGPPALDALTDDADVYVLELSSFQLELTHRLPTRVSTVLNLSADHMDRHASMAYYGALKARIFAHAATALVNDDDAAVAAMDSGEARVLCFGRAPHVDYRLVEATTPATLTGSAHGTTTIPVDELQVSGRHNWLNALAVWALTACFGIADERIRAQLGAFAGLAHRCQIVGRHRDVIWIDDSKGTNLGAAAASLASLDTPVVWLAGGQSKGADFRDIGELAGRCARVAIVYGEDAGAIATALVDYLPVARRETLTEAVACALDWARPGDSVLLSPGCASLDQFSDYAARGRAFVDAVEKVAA